MPLILLKMATIKSMLLMMVLLQWGLRLLKKPRNLQVLLK
ncbi:Uncharacterised protein [Salmonella enterica]|nr:Uncharacterised protein [Salmonella enterica]